MQFPIIFCRPPIRKVDLFELPCACGVRPLDKRLGNDFIPAFASCSATWSFLIPVETDFGFLPKCLGGAAEWDAGR